MTETVHIPNERIITRLICRDGAGTIEYARFTIRAEATDVLAYFGIRIPADSNDPADLEYKRTKGAEPHTLILTHESGAHSHFDDFEIGPDETAIHFTDEQHEQIRNHLMHTVMPQ